MKTKFIFVTGGVLSGIGKGIAAASIGAILARSGVRVFSQKFDGYLNTDPGTMSPTQHGEVYVLADGAETDLDLGHYERFIGVNLNRLSSLSSGKLYSEIIERERRGDYLGRTVQVIPHLTNLVKEKIYSAAKIARADVMIIEIGGTVGDMESEYILEAARQVQHEVGYRDVMFAHLTLLPWLEASRELKTKPTQASIRDLRRLGIRADLLIVRADHEITPDMIKKLALHCDTEEEAIIAAPTVSSIYEVPLNFYDSNIHKFLAKRLKMKKIKPDLSDFREFISKKNSAEKEVVIAMVGKYIGLEDAYFSVRESLDIAATHLCAKVKIKWVDSEKIEKYGVEKYLSKVDGVCIPGGFGSRGIEGKILAAKFCRENSLPYLGLCLGSQIMAIEFARSVAKLSGANSTEFNSRTKYPVVSEMISQRGIKNKGGTMRLGDYPCVLSAGTLTKKLYKKNNIVERHRHRFEFNPKFRNRFARLGLKFAGLSPDKKLVEIVEIENHPFMIGSQFHPEFQTRLNKPHPLFLGFIKALFMKHLKN